MRNILVQCLKDTLEPHSETVQCLKDTLEPHSETVQCLKDTLEPGVFAAALEAVPSQDWHRTWPAEKTFMLRMTSKSVKDIIDKMRLPVVVRLHRAQKKLPFVMRQLTKMTGSYSIKTLELSRCYMRELVVVEMLEMLEMMTGVLVSQCSNLYYLNLHWNEIGNIGIETIIAALEQCTSLRHLDISYNDIGAEGATNLTRVLIQFPKLAYLDISGNKIATGAKNIALAVKHCNSLYHLNMSSNYIGDTGLESFAGQINKPIILTHLYLGNNNLSSNVGLVAVLNQCPALILLDLCCNEINVNEAFASALRQCTALSHLNLCENQIDDAMIGRLASVLGLCTALAHLNLYENNIGDAGTECLALALGQCIALTHLNLSYNQIYNAGAESIASALGQCTALTHLNLSNNWFDETGEKRLIEVKKQCTALAYLDLNQY
jgi:Ran GTPase-activating protein (RanGAP) involved in mRNA processing and transport